MRAVVTITAGFFCGPGCAAAASAAMTKIMGGSWADALRAGATTWVSFNFSGFDTGGFATNFIANGFVNGAINVAAGGDFRSGFLSGGFRASFGSSIQRFFSAGGRIGSYVGSMVVGGTSSKIGGGKFANGAVTAAFANLFSGMGGARQQQAGNSSGGFFNGVLDVAGKIWALPNTVIGLAYGGVGHVLGWIMGTNPNITFANNAIQFENNPLMASAMTFGNVIVYGTGKAFQPTSDRYYGTHIHSLGYEEMQHSYQAQVLGPLYFPAHIVSGASGLLMNGDWHGSAAFLEVSPHSRNPSPW